MADLKETNYRKLFNAALLNIESERPEDKSIERIKYSVEKALNFWVSQKIFLIKIN